MLVAIAFLLEILGLFTILFVNPWAGVAVVLVGGLIGLVAGLGRRR